jgi:ectoine hydroxylase-related dioxygenase (phytanoyl-CoA dioxygenase family)
VSKVSPAATLVREFEDAMLDHMQLHRDGYALLRGAIPGDWIEGLRDAFDAGVKPSGQWPVPRGPDWRHSMLDLDPRIHAVCRLPVLLQVVSALIGSRFFIAQVEGREPLPGGGHQDLHRDLSAQRPGDTVNAIAFFDDFDADNGATRLIPGTHRPALGETIVDPGEEQRAQYLSGCAGDIFVFDADLVHAGSLNRSGGRRRSILIGYFDEQLYDAHRQTAPLRGVRMDTSERSSADGRASRN